MEKTTFYETINIMLAFFDEQDVSTDSRSDRTEGCVDIRRKS